MYENRRKRTQHFHFMIEDHGGNGLLSEIPEEIMNRVGSGMELLLRCGIGKSFNVRERR